MVWGLLITPIWGWWFEVNVAWTRYGTFNDVYKRRWKEILQFRQKSHFTTCDVCAVLKAQLADRGLSMEQKLGSLQLYRSHLHDQFADRSILSFPLMDLTNQNLLSRGSQGWGQMLHWYLDWTIDSTYGCRLAVFDVKSVVKCFCKLRSGMYHKYFFGVSYLLKIYPTLRVLCLHGWGASTSAHASRFTEHGHLGFAWTYLSWMTPVVMTVLQS